MLSQPLDRSEILAHLQTQSFDVCIIGGGASGAGCALDAAARGLKTALIEADDFGAVTSGTSTKLVHGGVRYLEQAVKTFDPRQLSLVRKALHERLTLLKIAPHLVHPLALLTPCANLIEGLYYSIGLKVYDLLAGKRQLSPSRWLGRAAVLRQFPAFDPTKLHSAVQYYDGQFDDIRLNLALVQTAAERGATVANHLKAIDFEHDKAGTLRAVTVQDTLTGRAFSIRATVFVNATGTRADALRQGANAERPARMRASKGSHVVLPKSVLPAGQAALLVPKTADGRVLFAIPWRDHWLIGTTDTEADPSETPYLLPDEAEYLTRHVSQYTRQQLSADQVTGGFAGLRPLLQADPGASSKSLVRDHEVEIDAKSGLISIMGGKWTTYRLMAKETIDVCCDRLSQFRPCRTETLMLVGGENYSEKTTAQFIRQSHLPTDVSTHLDNTYGTRAGQLTNLIVAAPSLGDRLVAGHPFVGAEVVYAVRHEMARTLPDVLLRRIRLGLVDWRATLTALPTTAALMGDELGWTDTDRQTAETAFRHQMNEVIRQATVPSATELERV
jgi:glycerol-3-phosphate dehydrogenase